MKSLLTATAATATLAAALLAAPSAALADGGRHEAYGYRGGYGQPYYNKDTRNTAITAARATTRRRRRCTTRRPSSTAARCTSRRRPRRWWCIRARYRSTRNRA